MIIENIKCDICGRTPYVICSILGESKEKFLNLMKDFPNGEFLWHTFGYEMKVNDVCTDCAHHIYALSLNSEVREVVQKYIKKRKENNVT